MSSRFLLLFVSGLLTATTGFAQYQESSPAGDTVKTSDLIKLTPDRRTINTGTLGTYAFGETDRTAMQTYAGFNVINTLRGHVPNLSIDGNVTGIQSSLRDNTSMLLIDGVPFTSSISEFYNLNSFEFGSVAAIGSANQFVLYGPQGVNGAIILESKNGRGRTQPFFEANSSTTFSRFTAREAFGPIEEFDQWMFTNAAAYAQDYGLVDLRASFTNTYGPDGSSDTWSRDIGHAFKVNAGFDISPAFSARIISDLWRYNQKSESSQYEVTYDNSVPSFNTTLFLNFKANDWLSLSSQSGLSRNRNSADYQQPQYFLHGKEKQSRDFVNLFATATPKLRGATTLTAMIGGQLEKQTYHDEEEFRTPGSSGGSQYDLSGNKRAILSQVSAGVGDVLFADVNLRYDYMVDVRDDFKNQTHYSINTAFDFAKLAGWKGNAFSSGRLRASFGKMNALEFGGFPLEQTTFFFGNVIPNPNLKPTARKSTEIGTDLSFAQSRLILNATYFNNLNDQFLGVFYTPGPGGYPIPVVIDFGERRMKGWEFALGAYPVHSESLSVLTKLIYDNNDGDIFGSQSSSLLINTTPNWRASFLTQIRAKQIFATILIAHDDFDEQSLIDQMGYPLGNVDLTQTMLRDLSVGYDWQKVTVSLSGRNLWEIVDKKDMELTNYQKTVTASVTLRF